MSTEYLQAPSQHAFFTAQPSQDPWVISANNVDWGKGGTRHMVHSLPMFDDEGSWASNPSSPIFGSLGKGAASPTPFSLNGADPWQQDSPEDEDEDVDNDSQDGSDDDENGPSLYKTELCRSFVETGACRYGLKCQFAHGSNELRPVHRHPKYKTEICKTFHTLGTCPYGTRCRFIHTRPNNKKSNRNLVLVSPYASPPLSSLSRSPSPTTTATETKWNPSWPENVQKEEHEPIPIPRSVTPPPAAVEREEEGDGKNEDSPATVPDSPSPSKKRLAIFRTISKDSLYD